MGASVPDPAGAVFFYDLGSPHCYLAAEQVLTALPVVAEWEPVSGAALGVDLGSPDREAIEREAAALGLLPVRWPLRWPPKGAQATLAATYAKRIGRAVAFSLATFRQVFAGGRDLDSEDTVLIAGAASEMHPSALLKGIALRSVGEALDAAHARARAAGVDALPAISIGAATYTGPTALQDAARELAVVPARTGDAGASGR